MMEKKKIHKTKILYASFNKDKSCLSLGMQTGYRIYDLTQDLSKKNNLSFYERILGKAISIIEMLEKTSFLALSGVDDDPHLSSKHVKIYDDREGKVITEIKFKTKVILKMTIKNKNQSEETLSRESERAEDIFNLYDVNCVSSFKYKDKTFEFIDQNVLVYGMYGKKPGLVLLFNELCNDDYKIEKKIYEK